MIDVTTSATFQGGGRHDGRTDRADAQRKRHHRSQESSPVRHVSLHKARKNSYATPQRMKCTRQRHSGQGVFFWTSRATGAPADSSSGSTLVSFVPPWNWTCNWFFPYKRSTSGRRPAWRPPRCCPQQLRNSVSHGDEAGVRAGQAGSTEGLIARDSRDPRRNLVRPAVGPGTWTSRRSGRHCSRSAAVAVANSSNTEPSRTGRRRTTTRKRTATPTPAGPTQTARIWKLSWFVPDGRSF